MAFPFGSLAPELQLNVLECLDLGSLAIASRLNKNISRETTRLLWQNIEFQRVGNNGWDWGTMNWMRKFFLTCDELQRNRPSRWRQLAMYVHTLKLGRMLGAAIPFENSTNEFEWLMTDGCLSIFDIIADFSQLRCFHVYCRSGFDSDVYRNDTITRMRGTMPELRELAIGGIINEGVVSGLLSFPEKIERFYVINLQDGTVGQEQHSGGLLFLRPIAPRFANLTHLHLCKLAELVE